MDSLQMKCCHIYMFIRLSATILNYLENGTELLELCTVCELPGMLWATERHGRMVELLLRIQDVGNIMRASWVRR